MVLIATPASSSIKLVLNLKLFIVRCCGEKNKTILTRSCKRGLLILLIIILIDKPDNPISGSVSLFLALDVILWALVLHNTFARLVDDQGSSLGHVAIEAIAGVLSGRVLLPVHRIVGAHSVLLLVLVIIVLGLFLGQLLLGHELRHVGAGLVSHVGQASAGC